MRANHLIAACLDLLIVAFGGVEIDLLNQLEEFPHSDGWKLREFLDMRGIEDALRQQLPLRLTFLLTNGAEKVAASGLTGAAVVAQALHLFSLALKEEFLSMAWRFRDFPQLDQVRLADFLDIDQLEAVSRQGDTYQMEVLLRQAAHKILAASDGTEAASDSN